MRPHHSPGVHSLDALYAQYRNALRQKLEASPERPQHILTEQGVGYRLRTVD